MGKHREQTEKSNRLIHYSLIKDFILSHVVL